MSSGAGTDPIEGAALAVSIMKICVQRAPKLPPQTHYAELKAYALETAGVSNGSASLMWKPLSPTYNLLIGVPGVQTPLQSPKARNGACGC
jgi:DNA mismatch repair protein MutS2